MSSGMNDTRLNSSSSCPMALLSARNRGPVEAASCGSSSAESGKRKSSRWRCGVVGKMGWRGGVGPVGGRARAGREGVSLLQSQEN